MMVDKLVMLLSTDWFKPYWASIGIDTSESAKTAIQQGCREIVGQMLSGAKNYYLVSFSDQRKNKTRSTLESLVRKSAAGSTLLEAIEAWSKMSDEDLKAAWIYADLTGDLFSGEIREGDPKLDPAITAIMVRAQEKYDLAPFEFMGKCEASETPWDRDTRGLTPQLPTALADDLAAVLTAQRFEIFWKSMRDRLTPRHREELVNWYRAMASARGRRDLVPAYIR